MYLRRYLFLLACFIYPLFAQTEESDLRIFGYFQNSFTYQSSAVGSEKYTSFNMQQLNLIAQKDLSKSWRAFINFKLVNNFSTEKRWGAYSIEEAWLRYYSSNAFNLKLGLQIPVFNSFNEVKDRTPLLPYVIKPLVYEDSFSEIISIEAFVPKWAFAQAYGFWGRGEFKLDYAAYIGNSPNVQNWQNEGISGLDTTETFLTGGRLGIRYKNLKMGFSTTSDHVVEAAAIPHFFAKDSSRAKLIHRMRFGVDFSYEFHNIDLKFEYIKVFQDENIPDLNLDKEFYYATVGYYFDDQWYGYISHWFNGEKFLPYGDLAFEVETGGLACRFTDSISFKIQYAFVRFDTKIYNPEVISYDDEDFHHISIAASVFF